MSTRRRDALAWLLWSVACSSSPESDLFTPAQTAPIGGASAGSNAVSAGGSGNTSSPTAGATSNEPPAENNQGGAGTDGAAGEPSSEPPSEGGAPGEQEPQCGNGKIEMGEECDGGALGELGCSANCEVDCSALAEEAIESQDHHCYAGYDEASFEGAQQACAALGGHLATITSASENELVAGLVNNSKWIGASEPVARMQPGMGAYGWLTGELLVFTRWADGEPDRDAYFCDEESWCYEHCVIIDDQGQWEDRPCEVEDGYVCEWDPVGTP